MQLSDEILISKVAPRAVDALRQNGPMQSAYRQGTEIQPEPIKLTLWQQIRLLPYIIHISWGVLMQNPKTTITGIVGGVAYLVNAIFGVVIPSEAIVAVTVFCLGLFSKDGNA